MFVVGLVQNQSEMAHYGYADTRPLMEQLRTGKEEYSHKLYTADNIESLSSDISENRIDAVIFASNAFNDKQIEAFVFSNEFKKLIEANIHRLGILVCHQRKLSQKEVSPRSLSFLPYPYNSIAAVSRPQNEKSIDGNLECVHSSNNHISLLYPETIDVEKLKQDSKNFKNLPGLYWHYWENVRFADWDILLEDNTHPSDSRPILLCSKESLGHRIVVSAMPIDWQDHQHLFTNLTIYIVEGRHDTAVLCSEFDKDRSFNFLIKTMSSKKFPYTLYHTERDLNRLKTHLQNGVHSVLLMGPDISLSGLDSDLHQTINNSLQNNHLKILDVESNLGEMRKFSTMGRSKFAYHLLQRAELAIHSELRSGQIDGSFWSTVETLQSLEQLESKSTDYRNMVGEYLEQVNKREKDGSYDETFSATCAFYWLRAKYLGNSNRETKRTEAWLKKNIDQYDTREKALGYATLAEMNQLSPADREKLEKILCDLKEDISEFDSLVYLKASLCIKSEADIFRIVSALDKKQNNGIWIDLATTASVSCILIDILNFFKEQPPKHPEVLTKIESMIFNAVIKILEAFENPAKTSRKDPYPWDGKASTTVKCLQAWLKFDDLLDLPVYDIVSSLQVSNDLSEQIASSKIALTVLDEINNENKTLTKFKQKFDFQNKIFKRQSLILRVAALVAVPLIYILISILWGIYQIKGSETFLSLFIKAFIDSWQVHAGLITSAASIAGIYFAIQQHRNKGRS